MGLPAPLGVSAAGTPPLGDQANAVVAGTFGVVGPGKAFAFRGPMNLAIWASINTTLTTTALSGSATVASGTGLAAGDAINSNLVPDGTTVATISGTGITFGLPTVTLRGNISTAAAEIWGLPETAGLLGATVTVSSNAEQVTLPANTTVIGIAQAAVPPTNNSPGVPGIVQLSAAPTVSPPINGPVAFDFAVTANAVLGSGADAAATFTGAGVTYTGTVQLERSFDGGATWLVANVGAGTLAQFAAGTPVNLTFGEPERNVLWRLNCTAINPDVPGTINYRISQTGGAAESLAVGPLSQG